MSQYCNITSQEFRDFLKIEKGWRESVSDGKTKELVFNFNLASHPEITVKVCSGIKIDSGQSRGCGDDAIRIYAVNTKMNCGWIRTIKCYRVFGWKENLKRAIFEVIRQSRKRFN